MNYFFSVLDLLNHYLRSLALNSNYDYTCRSSDRYVVGSSYLVSDRATQDISYGNHLISSALDSYNALATDYLNTSLSSDCLVSGCVILRLSQYEYLCLRFLLSYYRNTVVEFRSTWN